jgi:hypothetical protein
MTWKSLNNNHSLHAICRWLKEQIEELTSEEMCVKYLRLLRETVWPEGEFL